MPVRVFRLFRSARFHAGQRSVGARNDLLQNEKMFLLITEALI
jgi:hypothetical protein